MNNYTKKLFSLFLVVAILFSTPTVLYAENVDYVSVFGDLVDYENNNARLMNFLMANYMVASVDHFKDCYIVDLDNNSIPELLCLFSDDDHDVTLGYAACIEYDGGFKMGAEIPFDFSGGAFNNLWYRILESDGKFYIEEYLQSRYNDGAIAKDSITQKITMNKYGTENIFYSATLNGYTDLHNGTENYETYVNNQKVSEFDYSYVINNFNIVADSADYHYNPYSFKEVKYEYGKNYAKFWKKQMPAINVIVNGKSILFDQSPVIVNGRTLVPLRAIFESLGATVDWDGSTQTVTSVKGSTTISLTIGKPEIYINNTSMPLDVAPQILNDRTLVPVRAVAEAFNCKVDWNAETRTVTINSTNTDKVIETAVQLCRSNEILGGTAYFASYAEVDKNLYNTLNEIDTTLAVNSVVLDLVSAGTSAVISTACIVTGKYPSVDNFNIAIKNITFPDGMTSKILDKTAKDILKKKLLSELSSSIPDIESFVLTLGRNAYENNEKMLLDFMVLHTKIKDNNFNYDDAASYIILNDTLIMNRKTMAMAVKVLSNKLPQNILESLIMSTDASLQGAVKSLLGNTLSNIVISPDGKMLSFLLSTLIDYSLNQVDDWTQSMKQIQHPAIVEWATEYDEYNQNLRNKFALN